MCACVCVWCVCVVCVCVCVCVCDMIIVVAKSYSLLHTISNKFKEVFGTFDQRGGFKLNIISWDTGRLCVEVLNGMSH